MKKRLFITGVIRSGTTLFEKMINAHREIVSVSEPFIPIYKLLHSTIGQHEGISIDNYDTMGEYFADEKKFRIFKAIYNADLDYPYPASESKVVLERMRKVSILSHVPKIRNNLNEIKGETFKEVLDYLFSYVEKYYGNGGEKYVGTKEIWTVPLIPALARAYPEAKFIIPIRDPRAVLLSKNKLERKNPWLFLARLWREVAIMGWLFSNDEKLKDRIMVVRYEDLVREPVDIAKKVCKFLELEMDYNMIDPSQYVDGRGQQWLPISAFNDKKLSFNQDAVDRWKERLEPKIIEYIEYLCFAEMKMYGYEFYGSGKYELDKSVLINPPIIKKENLAEWMQEEYKDHSQLSIINELGKEIIREEILKLSVEEYKDVDQTLADLYFLDRKYLDYARKLVK